MKKSARLLKKPALRVVLCTAPAREAEGLARALLNERRIACANLLPGVQSLYWWKKELCCDTETLMVLKAPRKNIPALLKRLSELHSYEVPEFLVLAPEAASAAYTAWALAEAAPAKVRRRVTSSPK